MAANCLRLCGKLEAEEGGGEEIIELTLPEQFPDILEDCSIRLDDLLWQNTPETRERYEDSLKLFCIAFRVSCWRGKRGAGH